MVSTFSAHRREEPMSRIDPLEQDEALTLEAELRRALQHRRAAQQQAQETREELSRLIDRARAILERGSPGAPAPGPSAEEAQEAVDAKDV
jgi:hypothetical protein